MSESQYHGHPRREMIPFVPPEARVILDVGCGAGVFGAGLKASRRETGTDLEIWGVEMAPKAAQEAAKVLDRVLTGDINQLLDEIPQQHFDAIVFNDVLEHVADPAGLLTQAAGFLKPGGQVVASVPNVRYFFNVWNLVWNGSWEYTDEGILDRTHLRFFTRSSMIQIFQDCGFEIVGLKGINPTGSLKFKLANALSLGRFSDMQYLQFALVARQVFERG